MSNEELMSENRMLRERITFLENTINRGASENKSAYNQIRLMIIEKTEKNVPLDYIDGKERNWTRKEAERNIMRDLKWDLRVRTISNFKQEHVKQAKEYIDNYILPEKYKKSRWA